MISFKSDPSMYRTFGLHGERDPKSFNSKVHFRPTYNVTSPSVSWWRLEGVALEYLYFRKLAAELNDTIILNVGIFNLNLNGDSD